MEISLQRSLKGPGIASTSGGAGTGIWNAGTVNAVNPNELVVSSNTLQFITGPTVQATATTGPLIVNGNTSAPSGNYRSGTMIQVIGADGVQPRISIDCYGNTNPNAGFIGRSARGTEAAPSAVQASDFLASMVSFGYGATAFASSNRGGFAVNASENWTDTAQGTFVNINATPNGGTATANILQVNGQRGGLLSFTMPSTTSFANDAAAAAGGVGIGEFYRNGSVIQCRIT